MFFQFFVFCYSPSQAQKLRDKIPNQMQFRVNCPNTKSCLAKVTAISFPMLLMKKCLLRWSEVYAIGRVILTRQKKA
jgi:hypothetical protein